MHIFIDESGDLGSSKGSSQFFVLAAVVVDDPKKLEKDFAKNTKISKSSMQELIVPV